MHTKERNEFLILKTQEFDDWLESLPPKAKVIVLARLDMISIGHLGDYKRFEGLIELRWVNGVRVYGFFWGAAVVVALIGGNKNGQNRDIKKAKRIREKILNGTRPFFKP
jgi:putative addiction module killer protein